MNRRTNTIVTLSLIAGGFVWLFVQPIIPYYFGATFYFVFFVFFMAAIGVYYFLNPDRDKEQEEKERSRKEFKKQLRRANRFSCPNCGTVVEGNDCSNCKAHYPDIRPSKFPENDYSYNKKSYGGMYALSILLGFIGGIIAWASLRNENPSVGVNCLILGIIVTIVSMGIGAVLQF